MAPDQNKYQTKVSLHQQVVIHLKSTQIGKISEAVWDWLNTTWHYIPQVSMYATISVTIHITPTVIVTMMRYAILCLQFSYLSKWKTQSLFAISSLEVDEFLPHKHRSYTIADSHIWHNYHSYKYSGKWTVPCIETKTVATTIVQCNY